MFDFGDNSPGADPVDVACAHLVDRAHSLNRFYRALRRVEAREPGAVVRILHFGDSPISADQISGDARALLQEKFGEAGEGFVLIAKPWAWYNHRDLEIHARGWSIHAASQDDSPDGVHGLGGATFEGGPGAMTRYVLVRPQVRMEVLYWARPGGGTLEVRTDAGRLAEIRTASARAASGFRMVGLAGGARKVEIRVVSGRVRLFGVSFENDGPGIRYHSLGLNAAQIRTVLQHFEPRQWAEQIRHQSPDLVILNYGTNESGYPAYIDGAYRQDVRELVRRVQMAAPDASILVMSPMDRGVRIGGAVVTMPKLPVLVEIQREVAAAAGCAFFNTFQAMGGEGTMARWYRASPRLAGADFMHPLPAGARRVGKLIEEALYQGYVAQRSLSEARAGEHR